MEETTLHGDTELLRRSGNQHVKQNSHPVTFLGRRGVYSPAEGQELGTWIRTEISQNCGSGPRGIFGRLAVFLYLLDYKRLAWKIRWRQSSDRREAGEGTRQERELGVRPW